MRLHLDTSAASGSVEAADRNPPSAATGKSSALTGQPQTGSTLNAEADPGDSVTVSGSSSAWSASFSDRAGKVSQLAAAVQSGTYRVSGALISQAIVASATA